MSHVTTVAIQIRDLNALKAAAREQGCEFIEGKTTFEWYRQHVGDYPLPAGMTKEQMGKCDHVIHVPGVNYEIGVVKKQDGTYTLAYDFYGGHGRHDGHKLLEKFGDGLKKLCQGYAIAKTTLEAKAKGWMVGKHTLPNGTVKLTLTGV